MEVSDSSQEKPKAQVLPQQAPENRTVDTEIIDLYDYGFTNGLLKVDPDFFDHWVEAFDQEKLYNLKLHTVIKEKQQLRERLQQSEQQLKELEKTTASSERQAQETNRKITQTKEQIENQQEQEETLEKAIEDSTPHYKAASVGLFLVGGLFFLLADVLFSQNVLTNVLDMPGWEAWILAIAVGALTFAIKPAVDRYFEQPYIKGENKGRNYAFLIIVSLLILAALGILGSYRNQSQYIMEERFRLESKISKLEANQALGNDLSESDKKSLEETLPAEISLLDETLYLDWRIQTGFILISILFALAGAICLSIGLPAGSQLIVRQKHRKKMRTMLKSLKQLKRTLDQLHEQLADQETAYSIAWQQLKHLPSLEDLRAEERALLQKESLLQEEKSKHREQRHKHMYKLGYLRGQQYQLSDKLVVHPSALGSLINHRAYSHTRRGNSMKNRSKPSPSPNANPKKSTNYLHEQLREMIDYNFNKQQNLNGKHED